MDFMNAHYLWAVLALPIFFGVWYKWGRRSHTLKNTKVTRARVSTTPGAVLTGLIWVSKVALWTSLSLALAGSFFSFSKLTTDAAGITYITVDTSGSTVMAAPQTPFEKILAGKYDKRLGPDYKPPERPQPNPGNYVMDQKPDDDAPRSPMVIDVELGVVKAIFENSPGVRLGLTIFDDKMYYIYPATKEQGVVLNLLSDIKTYSNEWSASAGTNFDGPSGGPYDGALQGAINVFQTEPKNAIRTYVMVTDGSASISEERMKQLVTAFKEMKINFFLIGVGSDWKDLKAAGSIQRILEFAKQVDGFVAPANDEAKFNEAMRRINDLARSSVRTVVIKERQDALLLLLGIAFLSFVAWLSLSAIRRVSL